MSYAWFKLHNDIISDIKLRRFTASEKWAWIVLLALANQSSERGIIKADDEDIADFCEFNTTQDWLYYRDKLIAKGMVELSHEGLKILNWEKRQYEYPSDKPEATRERKRKQRAKSRENVTSVTSVSRECHETDTDPDLETDQKRLEKYSPPLYPPPTQSESQEGREGILEKSEEKDKTPQPTALSQLPQGEKEKFLSFCNKHYEANNPGRHLSLPQEYAKKYFDDLYGIYQKSTGLKVDLEPTFKTEAGAIAICENYPVEQWPQWILKFLDYKSEYFKRFEAFYFSQKS